MSEDVNPLAMAFLQCMADSHAVPPISEESRLVLAELESMGVYPNLTDEKLDELLELREMINEVFGPGKE